jgi:predicted DCC family thiol-disulfide oxidoreductase YuxK
MTPALAIACAKAVHVVRADGRVERAGLAMLSILERTGWGAAARALKVPPLIWLAELVYAIVARNRPFFARFTFRGDGASRDDAD